MKMGYREYLREHVINIFYGQHGTLGCQNPAKVDPQKRRTVMAFHAYKSSYCGVIDG